MEEFFDLEENENMLKEIIGSSSDSQEFFISGRVGYAKNKNIEKKVIFMDELQLLKGGYHILKLKRLNV